MDKIKIGRFITECRKNKNLTQEQLAEKLNITNKSISKWENGICLPDSMLYEPLCEILEISMNELFEARRIEEQDYKKIADENLLRMLKYRFYRMSDQSITFEEFDHALGRISEISCVLKGFSTKEEAVDFLMKESNCSYEECENVYHFYTGLFKDNLSEEN